MRNLTLSRRTPSTLKSFPTSNGYAHVVTSPPPRRPHAALRPVSGEGPVRLAGNALLKTHAGPDATASAHVSLYLGLRAMESWWMSL